MPDMNLAVSIQQIESKRSPAHVAQAVEHFLGKEKVPGSNPGVGSTRTFCAKRGHQPRAIRAHCARRAELAAVLSEHRRRARSCKRRPGRRSPTENRNGERS